MISELFSTILCILMLGVLRSFYYRRRPKGFPPGPVSLPVIGNLIQVGMEPYNSVFKMREKYGDVIGIDLGSRRTIFINEYKLLKEAFSMPEFSGRAPFDQLVEPKSGLQRGLGFTSGQTWSEQRRFTFSYIQSELRNGDTLENYLKGEIAIVIEELKKSSGTAVNTRYVFNIPSINSLWLMLAGKRYSIKDPSFTKVIKHSSAISTSFVSQGIHFFFPDASKTWPKLSGVQTFKTHLEALLGFMSNIIEEHKVALKDGICRDFVDSYIEKIEKTTDVNSTFYGETGEGNLKCTLRDLFLAGTDTVSSTLNWLLFLVAHFPDVQNKLIEEIGRNLNNGRSISLRERIRFPYVEAVIEELLRFSAVSPLGVFHETIADVNFHGYEIPKGTVAVSNLHGILHDPEVWCDPEQFRPERFLSDNKEKLIRHPGMVAFGAGRRICPGEAFARAELFIFVTSLFQNFRVEFDPTVPNPPLKYVPGWLNTPVEHQLIFHKLLE